MQITGFLSATNYLMFLTDLGNWTMREVRSQTGSSNGEKDWRLRHLEDMICTGLEWYYNSEILRTVAHKRTIYDGALSCYTSW